MDLNFRLSERDDTKLCYRQLEISVRNFDSFIHVPAPCHNLVQSVTQCAVPCFFYLVLFYFHRRKVKARTALKEIHWQDSKVLLCSSVVGLSGRDLRRSDVVQTFSKLLDAELPWHWHPILCHRYANQEILGLHTADEEFTIFNKVGRFVHNNFIL